MLYNTRTVKRVPFFLKELRKTHAVHNLGEIAFLPHTNSEGADQCAHPCTDLAILCSSTVHSDLGLLVRKLHTGPFCALCVMYIFKTKIWI